MSGQQVGDRVRLTISDTGSGIPPEGQEKVFDRFYQVDSGERRAYRGMGLGSASASTLSSATPAGFGPRAKGLRVAAADSS